MAAPNREITGTLGRDGHKVFHHGLCLGKLFYKMTISLLASVSTKIGKREGYILVKEELSKFQQKSLLGIFTNGNMLSGNKRFTVTYPPPGESKE